MRCQILFGYLALLRYVSTYACRRCSKHESTHQDQKSYPRFHSAHGMYPRHLSGLYPGSVHKIGRCGCLRILVNSKNLVIVKPAFLPHIAGRCYRKIGSVVWGFRHESPTFQSARRLRAQLKLPANDHIDGPGEWLRA